MKRDTGQRLDGAVPMSNHKRGRTAEGNCPVPLANGVGAHRGRRWRFREGERPPFEGAAREYEMGRQRWVRGPRWKLACGPSVPRGHGTSGGMTLPVRRRRRATNWARIRATPWKLRMAAVRVR